MRAQTRVLGMAAHLRRLTVSLLLMAGPGLCLADTREGYENSTTRQQIERMHEKARANAQDTPAVPATDLRGSALEGQMNRLRAEQQAERDARDAAAARKRQELEEWRIRYDASQREIRQRMGEQLAREYAAEQQALAVTQERMAAYVRALPADQPLSVADYDRLLELAAPRSEAMLPMLQQAYRDYPQAFAVRHAFMQLSACPGLRSSAAASSKALFPEEEPLRAQCKARQLATALPALAQASQTGDTLDRALSCALMAGARASLGVREDNGLQQFDVDLMKPRLEAWLDKRRQPCAGVVPPGSALDRGLVQPLVRDNARGDYKRVSVSVHYLWPLLARSSWTGVDLNDAAAVQRVYDMAVGHYRALNP